MHQKSAKLMLIEMMETTGKNLTELGMEMMLSPATLHRINNGEVLRPNRGTIEIIERHLAKIHKRAKKDDLQNQKLG